MSQAPAQIAARTVRRRLGALRHDNYRLFVSGQAVSTVGTWVQSIGLSWLVLRVTHSALDVGLVVAVQFLPMLLASRSGARMADRHPKRRVLLFTQAAFMMPSIALFLLAFTGEAQLWSLLLVALLAGLINLFDVPARQAFLVDMVGRDDLVNAIAVNSSVFNAAAVVGPLLAGVLIQTAGVEYCFLVNGVSYLAAIAALWMMRNLPSLAIRARRPSTSEQVIEGGQYLLSNVTVALLLLAVAAFSLLATNRLVLLPLFADRVLHAGAYGFGVLAGMMALGSLFGALHLSVSGAQATGRRQLALAALWVAALEGFALSRSVWLSSLLLIVAGYCQICFLAISNSRIQTATPDRLRERVLNLYTQVLAAMSPLGAVLLGALITVLGAPKTQALGAVTAGGVVAVIWLMRPNVFLSPQRP